jgi:hypothetical protein
VRAAVLFAALIAGLFLVAGWVMTLLWGLPAERRAIAVSGVIAFVTQLFAFGVVKLSVGKNVMAGWGLGILLRVIVLGAYGAVIVKAFALPSGPALLSLAMFFFLSTLLEPLLLKP